jgi:hypothetical protein
MTHVVHHRSFLFAQMDKAILELSGMKIQGVYEHKSPEYVMENNPELTKENKAMNWHKAISVQQYVLAIAVPGTTVADVAKQFKYTLDGLRGFVVRNHLPPALPRNTSGNPRKQSKVSTQAKLPRC